ncbi:hypothetical protein [Natrinema soli]|uniref:Uncharacterized protein n=1 Tax=Natrinema soli TaxID=1930624 RepID=A0ABD5SRH7_9EURY|nr:hypothetical protein [Natrinema soli]
MPVYGGTSGVYAGGSGVYSDASAGRQVIETYERGNLTPYTFWTQETGQVTEDAAFPSGAQQAWRQQSGRTLEGWASPQSSKPALETWPQPGDTFSFRQRFNLTGDGPWQTWVLFGGGDDRYPRYQFEIGNDVQPRIQVRPDRYDVATALESGYGTLDIVSGDMLDVVVQWRSQAAHGNNGIRVLVFNGGDLPADLTIESWDAGEHSVTELVDMDSVDHPNDDGSGVVPQEPGRLGFRGSNEVQADFGDVWLHDRPDV